MRAVAVFPSTRQVRLVDVPEPVIGSGTDVKVRVLETGVCGTDKEICSFHYGVPPKGSEFLIIGHECLGEVIETGPEVGTLRKGDLVVMTVRRPCPHSNCDACKAGRQDFCYTGDFTERGIKEAHGFMTEFVVDDESFMIKVPRSLREVAVMVEPLTIAEKALIQVWQIQQRLPWSCPMAPDHKPGVCHHAVILGAGPIGLLGAMAFKAAGFGTFVYSLEPEESEKAALVRSFGAEYISARVTPVDKLVARMGTIDVVYEAAGASKLSFQVLKEVGPNAAFVFTGVPGIKGPVEVETDLLMRQMVLKNQVLFGTVNAGRDAFEAAVRDLGRFMKEWPDATRALITGRFDADRIAQLATWEAPGIKNVIAFAESPAGKAPKGRAVAMAR